MGRRHRRAFLSFLAVALVASCASPSDSGGGSTVAIQPPTLAQVKAFLNTLSPELPIFLNELLQGKQITQAQFTQGSQYIDELQQLITQLDQLTGGNPQALVNQIGQLLATIMSFIPQAAPFIPELLILQAIIAAYLAQQPVTTPSGTPTPTPAPPTKNQMQAMHARTMAAGRR